MNGQKNLTTVIVVIVVLVVLAALAWWWFQQRQIAPVPEVPVAPEVPIDDILTPGTEIDTEVPAPEAPVIE